MKTLLKAAALASVFAAVPAVAQVAVGQNTAVVDLNAAVSDTAAFKAATGQIQTAYKAQIDAYNARATALQAELAPLQKELQTLQANPGTPKATMDAKVAAYRARGESAQNELNRLALPFARPTAYAREQIEAKVEAALKAAMVAKKVNLVINPEAVIAVNPAANLTPDVVAQLDATVKSVSTAPPAGWQPGQPVGAAPTAGATPQGR